MQQNLTLRLFSLTAVIASQLLSATLFSQTLPECNIEAFPEANPGGTLCQRFQQLPPITPITLGIPGWQTDADVVLQTGSSVLNNKRVLIVGNFTVLSSLEFNNCWVQFSPGIKIIVGGGMSAQPVLTINFSRLFCCSGLWAGIDMEQGARVNTLNNSEIEDATTAIIADANVNTLSLKSTTFNRNRVGVQLGKTGISGGTSIAMVDFSDNKFTCTSPLNTTTNEITFAGVLIQRTNGTIALNNVGAITRFVKIHHGIYVGAHLQSVNLPQTFLSVFNCRFDNLIQNGIFAEPRMVLLARADTFINNGRHCIDILKSSQLQVNLCTFIYNDNVIPNGKNFYYGIRFNPSGSDIFFNDQYIQDNDFYVKFLYSAKIERIHCISMYGDLDGAEGDVGIDYNNFKMKFQQVAGISGETRAISLTGGIHPLTENSIIENDFEFENVSSQNIPSCAINVTNGDYNNLTIGDNKFHHTYNQFFLRGETAIRLIGSTGNENLVTINTFDDLPIGIARAYDFGIYAVDFDNTNYEYNFLHQCNTGFFYNGLSENTQMICNDMIGGNQLLKLDNAVIGQQGVVDVSGQIIKTNGNEWVNVEVPAFDANCSPTNFADFSKFYVTGDQAGSNTYFPDVINPNSGWFIGKGPDPDCIFATGQYSLEKSIATGELATALNNPADAWESERYLLNRLNRDTNLFNSWSGFQTFKNAKNGTAMAQLSAVQKMIDDAFIPSPTLSAQVSQKRTQVLPLLEQAAQLDNQIASGETTSLLAQRVQLQANIASRQSEVTALDSIYQSEVTAKLHAAKSANNAITVAPIFEENTKTVNGLLIDLILYGTLSGPEVNVLKSIAAHCPRMGGMAVFRARGILSDCDLEDIDEALCYPSQERGLTILDNASPTLQIVPNPNYGSFTLRADKLLGSHVCIYDTFGRLVAEHQVNETTPTLTIGQDLHSGTFFCRVIGADGGTQVASFIVLR